MATFFPAPRHPYHVGRSVADFHLPNVPAEWVLRAAHAFAAERGMAIRTWSPIHLLMTSGSVLWTGTRNLSFATWSVPGGANVHIEAWVETLGEFNADPGSVFGFIPRRDMWDIASAFVARLGVNPSAVFRHY